MGRRLVNRKIEVFSLHARTEAGILEARPLMFRFQSLQPRRRILESADRLVAAPSVQAGDVNVFFTVYEGPKGMAPLIFDSGNAAERVESLGRNEVVVTKTHCLIDVVSREAFVEFNQRGAKAHDIAELIASSLRRPGKDESLQVSLNPVAESEFLAAIGRFERVRVATARVARPNYDWTDDYNNLTAIGSASDAGTVEITAYAERNRSLSSRRGIIDFIRQFVQSGRSGLKDAKVTGSRTGDSSETTLSLSHFVQHRRVQVEVSSSGHVVSRTMKEELLKFAAARRGDAKRK
jgi:hypothetical protein